MEMQSWPIRNCLDLLNAINEAQSVVEAENKGDLVSWSFGTARLFKRVLTDGSCVYELELV